MISTDKLFETDNGFRIEEYMLHSIREYIYHHTPVGGFLRSVISNDLREAVYRADDTNIRNLPAFIYYFYEYAPYNCWGSRERYDAWIELRHEKKEEQAG